MLRIALPIWLIVSDHPIITLGVNIQWFFLFCNKISFTPKVKMDLSLIIKIQKNKGL